MKTNKTNKDWQEARLQRQASAQDGFHEAGGAILPRPGTVNPTIIIIIVIFLILFIIIVIIVIIVIVIILLLLLVLLVVSFVFFYVFWEGWGLRLSGFRGLVGFVG